MRVELYRDHGAGLWAVLLECEGEAPELMGVYRDPEKAWAIALEEARSRGLAARRLDEWGHVVATFAPDAVGVQS